MYHIVGKAQLNKGDTLGRATFGYQEYEAELQTTPNKRNMSSNLLFGTE